MTSSRLEQSGPTQLHSLSSKAHSSFHCLACLPELSFVRYVLMLMLMPSVDLACESGSSPLPTPPLPHNNVSLSPTPRLVLSIWTLYRSESDLLSPGVVLFACSHDSCQHQRHVTLGVKLQMSLALGREKCVRSG